MKLSPEVTAVPSPSHVDVDAVMAVRHALLSGHASAHEARVATALILNHELTGFRDIERASGLSVNTLRRTIPADGESSTLLKCSSRGRGAWASEDRRAMELEYLSSVNHNEESSTSTTNYVQVGPGGPGGVGGTEGLKEIEEHYVSRMTGVLDPSLDMWANVGEGQLGDAGWVLAMVTRMRSTTFSMDELKNLLRLGERQVCRVIEKLGSWARKAKVGRKVLVTVDFSLLVTADEEDVAENFLTTGRKDRKARLHAFEADVVREMATEVGRTAKMLWQNRVAEVRQLRAYAAKISALVNDQLIKLLETTLSCWEGERALRKHLAS